MGRKIVTKSAGFDDLYGNTDMEELTHLYKMSEGGSAERSAILNAVVLGSERAKRVFDYKDTSDVKFDLEDIDEVKFGDIYRAKIVLEVLYPFDH